jgi:ABC-type nitrate/sulfonate/bicarbonate transport system substrate-binding protein
MVQPVIRFRRGNISPSFLFSSHRWVLPLLLLVGVSPQRAAERVIFHPGWFASAQFAGVFSALDRGFYRDAGLDVSIEPFAFGQNGPAAIDAQPEICALGTIEGYILLQKRNDGADLKALAAMLQESPAGYMSLASSKVRSVRDFSGQRVGVHKFGDALYGWFTRKAGLAPGAAQMVFVGDDVTLLTRGKIEVMQGYATEEFIRLQDLTDNSSHFLSFTSLGFPSYSEILYTTAGQVDRHAATLKKFIAATRQGWIYALDHPRDAIASLATRMDQTVDLEHLRKTLTALKPYVCPDNHEALAPMDPGKWRTVQQVGLEAGLIRQIEPTEHFLLNW